MDAIQTIIYSLEIVDLYVFSNRNEEFVAGFSEITKIFCVFLQLGPVPPRYRAAAALLLLSGLRHSVMGPAHQQVCVRAAEPLQRRHLPQLQSGRRHHGQVRHGRGIHAADGAF